jgi:hypothetical protein
MQVIHFTRTVTDSAHGRELKKAINGSLSSVFVAKHGLWNDAWREMTVQVKHRVEDTTIVVQAYSKQTVKDYQILSKEIH